MLLSSTAIAHSPRHVAGAATHWLSVDAYNRLPPTPWLQVETPTGFRWNRVELPTSDLPDALEGLTVLHLSDFHFTRVWSKAHDELAARIGAAPPDLLLATGDFVDDKHDFRPALPNVLRLLAGFRARLGCYGIAGNHDGRRLAAALPPEHIRMIGGRRIVLRRNSEEIELIGLPDVYRKTLKPDFLRTLPPRKAGRLRVVLSHFPDHLPRTRQLGADLFLSGHTHGGQICLPGGVPIIKHTSMPRHLSRGIHRLGPTWHVVNRGFGFSGPGPMVRLFCPAEVIELRLVRRSDSTKSS